MDAAEARCIELIKAELIAGTTSVATVGARVFGRKEDAQMGSEIRSTHGTFRKFIKQRPEFRIDGDDNIRLVAVQKKSDNRKKKQPAKAKQDAKQPKSVDTECVSLILEELKHGERDIGAIGGRVFRNPSLARGIKAVHGSFRAFVESRPEFHIEQTSTGVVILSRGEAQKPQKARKAQKQKKATVPPAAKTHQRKKSLQLGDLESPVPEPGRWVLREDFKGRKSFGWFECGKCAKCWPSAHAFVNYAQGCQRCETEQNPKFMWQNDHSNERETAREPDDGPHDQDRCEACRHGDCVAAKLGKTPVIPVPRYYSYDDYDDYY